MIADTIVRAERWPVGMLFLQPVEAALIRAIECVAAVVFVADSVVLLCGVVARYGFGTPLTWSDGLASLLFLWLGMLGSVIAFYRLQHFSMGTLVARFSQPRQQVASGLSLIAQIVFLVLILLPSIEHALEEASIDSGSLGISNLWRALAMPVGFGLMLVFALIRLMKFPAFSRFAIAAAIGLAIGVALMFVAPLLNAIGNYRLLVFFVLLLGGAIILGLPIAFAFCLSTLIYLAMSTHAPPGMVVARVEAGMSHFVLLAVPPFVFLGILMEITGMAKAMVGVLGMLVGNLKGGLHYVLIAAMYLVSGISGSKTADMAAVAPALIPEMKARGADEGDLVALLAATGIQTETVPPSLVLITIASVTSVSLASLFTGGLLPALVLGLVLASVVWWRHRNDDLGHVTKVTYSQLGYAFIAAAPALALPFLIRAAVVEGIATATEVSTIGIAYALLYGAFVAWVLKFPVRWSALGRAVVDTVSLSGAVLFVIGATTAMAWALTQSGFSSELARAMIGLPGGSITFMLVSIAVFAILGVFLEGLPALILFAPLLFPIARQLGIHPVQYAMVAIFSMGLGLYSAPFGVGYYIACGIAGVDPSKGMRPLVGYMLALFLGVLLVAFIPWLSIGFLP